VDEVPDDEGGDDPPAKRARFEVAMADQEWAWELLAELAEYVQKCIYNFVKEQQLYDSILQKNPVPTNANFFKKVDAFIKELL